MRAKPKSAGCSANGSATRCVCWSCRRHPPRAAEPADDTARPGDTGEPGTGLAAVNHLQSGPAATARRRRPDGRSPGSRRRGCLVNFWASWCGPCVKEIGSLIRLVDHFDGRPFRVLTVNISEDRTQVADFSDTREIAPNFQVLYDLDRSAARRWRCTQLRRPTCSTRKAESATGYRARWKWGPVRRDRDGRRPARRDPDTGPGGTSPNDFVSESIGIPNTRASHSQPLILTIVTIHFINEPVPGRVLG